MSAFETIQPSHQQVLAQLFKQRTSRRDHDRMARALLRSAGSGEGNPIQRMVLLSRSAVALTAWTSAVEATQSAAARVWCTASCNEAESLGGRIQHVAVHLVEFSPGIETVSKEVHVLVKLRNQIVHNPSKEDVLRKMGKLTVKEVCKPMEEFRDLVISTTLSQKYQVAEPEKFVTAFTLDSLGLSPDERDSMMSEP